MKYRYVKTVIYTDILTGEVIKTIKRKCMNTGKINKVNYNKYIRINLDIELEFSKPVFLGYFIMLCKTLQFGTNKLVNKYGKSVSKEYIMDYLDIKPRTLFSFLRECEDKGYILKKEIYNDRNLFCYYINPDYVFYGSEISQDVKEMFNKDII